MRWSFTIPLDLSNLEKAVEEEAKRVAKTVGIPDLKKKAMESVRKRKIQKMEKIFKVEIYLTLSKKRYRGSPPIPREDIGLDLDNVAKRVLDGLGPIIGYRQKWKGEKEPRKARDASVVELVVKKICVPHGKETVDIRVEELQT